MAKKEDGGGSTGAPADGVNPYEKKSFVDGIGKYVAVALAVGLVAVVLSKLI